MVCYFSQQLSIVLEEEAPYKNPIVSTHMEIREQGVERKS